MPSETTARIRNASGLAASVRTVKIANARVRPLLAPLAANESCERGGREAHRGNGENRCPEDRCQWVVEEAVADERVAPRVPEVVPEGEAVCDEEPPLVDVRGEVDTRRCKCESGGSGDGRDRRGEQ
jgi:hypothetical protein